MELAGVGWIVTYRPSPAHFRCKKIPTRAQCCQLIRRRAVAFSYFHRFYVIIFVTRSYSGSRMKIGFETSWKSNFRGGNGFQNYENQFLFFFFFCFLFSESNLSNKALNDTNFFVIKWLPVLWNELTIDSELNLSRKKMINLQ